MASVLEIDLDGIINNIREYKKRMRSGQLFCAVVKANAYGLGVKKICQEIDGEVGYFAVSSKKEFLEIRKKVTKPILILDPIYENITILAKKSCEFCVSNLVQFNNILRLAKRNKKILYKIHIAINSGMNRFGFSALCDIDYIIKSLQKTQNIVIFGVFSHFYLGNDGFVSNIQVNKLNLIKRFIVSKLEKPEIIFHIANTDGFEFGKKFDMVRIGIGMFLNNNSQVFSLTSKIIEIQNLKVNETVGYGLNFIAKKSTKVAVVEIGYADGVMRNIAGKGYVLISGKKARILAVCMDSIIVDVTGLRVKLCDKVTLIGKNGEEEIFICDMAKWCDTIEYEIMTRFSNRVKKVYIGGKTGANNNREV